MAEKRDFEAEDLCVPPIKNLSLPKPGRTEQKNSYIQLYPNPANNKLFVYLNEALEIEGEIEINIHRLSGEIVIAKQVEKGSYNFEIDISGLPNGVYYSAVSINGEVKHTIKLIVIH